MDQTQETDAGFISYLSSIKEQGRTMLLPALLRTQNLYGTISKYHAELIGKELKVPLADISGVIDFYSMLTSQPTTKSIISVCTSPVCTARDANQLIDHLRKSETEFDIEPVACLGLCDHAPAAMIEDIQISLANLNNINIHEPVPPSNIYGDRVITRHCDPTIPPAIDKYLEKGGFEALRKVLLMPQGEIIETVKSSGLKGRGGAGFPTGLKWEGAANTEAVEKFVICNADESEPGTFKDRALLLGDPFRILEGMLIAAYAVGAQHGYCYIRGEYPDIQHIMENTIKQALSNGYLGDDIFGMRFNFHLEVRSGAGAYICGEETALFESIEGKRGFPRVKPPFPTTHGLFGKPTVINNVETFANIPLIFSKGVEAFKQMGSEAVPGSRLFSVSGDIKNPGVYELTKPITLQELVFGLAGGLSGKHALQGILLGGAAGKFIGPQSVQLLLTEETVRQKGLSLGSGAVMVFDDSRSMKEVLASLAHFFAHESCGKCYPCQLGTQRQAEILDRNMNGGLLPGDISRLMDVGWTMTDASLCGLGQTASLAVLSALELWPKLFTEKEQTAYG